MSVADRLTVSRRWVLWGGRKGGHGRGEKKKEVGKEAGRRANNASQSTLCRIQLATMAPNQVTCGVVHAGGVGLGEGGGDQAAISSLPWEA